MLIDTRIIARHGRHEVLAQRHEVTWTNGSAVILHPVQVVVTGQLRVIQPTLRALQHRPGAWLLVDLRDLAFTLSADLASLPTRDAVGLVYFTLRHRYANAPAFETAALEAAREAWLQEQQQVAA